MPTPMQAGEMNRNESVPTSPDNQLPMLRRAGGHSAVNMSILCSGERGIKTESANTLGIKHVYTTSRVGGVTSGRTIKGASNLHCESLEKVDHRTKNPVRRFPVDEHDDHQTESQSDEGGNKPHPRYQV